MNHLGICAKCNREFEPKKNGVVLLEMFVGGIYKAWQADLLKCPACGFELIAGVADQPTYNHFKDTGVLMKTLESVPLNQVYHDYEHSADTLEKRQALCKLGDLICPLFRQCDSIRFKNIAP